MKKLPIQIRIVIILLSVIIIYQLVTSITKPSINFYNTTKNLELSYNQKVQEQITNYDGYYLAFIDKQKNADVVGKDLFIKVTEIVMSNRKDGQSIAWKWVQENQNIPYNEFTDFYRELSSFISERYSANMVVEKEKQNIVRTHNALLATFPNNVFNKFIGVKPLIYKFGYVSDNTKNVFKQ